MDSNKKLRAFSNGEYVFSETASANQFQFYREDGQPLGEVGRMPMEMYQQYICTKMFEGTITEIVVNNISFERSIDDRCIRLTTFSFGEEQLVTDNKEDKGVKKLIKTLFNKKRKN